MRPYATVLRKRQEVFVDCSPEAQARYRRQLDELEARLYSGVSSVSDRSRSVGYHNPDYLRVLANELRDKLAFCAGCRLRVSRISYTPLVKGL